MKQQVMNFKAGIYVITGKSFLCPYNTTKTGDLVIGLDPLEKVDPKNMYAYVVDESGETQAVSRKYLHLIKKVDLTWKRSIYMTYNDEVRTRLKSMVECIKKFAPEYRESEQPQQATKQNVNDMSNKLNITPGPWSVSKGLVFILGHNNIPVCEETTPINDKWEHGDSTAIVTAVNNTYHKGINPEAVPEMLEALKYAVENFVSAPFETSERLESIIQKATL